MVKIKKNLVDLVIVFGFIYSKFFYLSLFSYATFNFTLSDLSLLLMLLSMIGKRLAVDKEIKNIVLLSTLFVLIIVLGSYLNGTSITSGLINYTKRWLLFLIVPVFIQTKFLEEDKRKLTHLIIINVIIFILINLSGVIDSLGSHQYIDSFNPNTLGLVMGLIILLLLNSTNRMLSFSVKLVLVLLSIIVFLSVASRSALITLLLVLFSSFIGNRSKVNIVKLVLWIAPVLLFLFFFDSITSFFSLNFSYSIERFYRTFYYGIFNDASASARLGTQSLILKTIFSSNLLLVFGIGFGNTNLTVFFLRNGMLINTADNLYVNLIAWSGIVGLIIFALIVFELFLIAHKHRDTKEKSFMYQIILFMLISGFTQDSFMEPTVGAFFILMFSFTQIMKRS